MSPENILTCTHYQRPFSPNLKAFHFLPKHLPPHHASIPGVKQTQATRVLGTCSTTPTKSSEILQQLPAAAGLGMLCLWCSSAAICRVCLSCSSLPAFALGCWQPADPALWHMPKYTDSHALCSWPISRNRDSSELTLKRLRFSAERDTNISLSPCKVFSFTLSEKAKMLCQSLIPHLHWKQVVGQRTVTHRGYTEAGGITTSKNWRGLWCLGEVASFYLH